MLQIGPELGIVHGSFLLLTCLFLLSLSQHPRYLGTDGTKECKLAKGRGGGTFPSGPNTWQAAEHKHYQTALKINSILVGTAQNSVLKYFGS